MENFEHLLDKYAQLLIQKGLNVGKDDYVLVNTDIEQIELARLLAKHAYEAGAKKVKFNWVDDQLTRLGYTNQSLETLTDIPQYRIDESNDDIEKRTKRIALRSSNPDALAGLDTEKIAAAAKANAKAFEQQRIATQANVVSWLVAAAAGKEWAKLVFPHLSNSQEQVDALWDQIFKTTRVYEADPISAWNQHEATLNVKADFLNAQQFDALHYKGPGVDFTIGLPANHVWESAGSVNQQGQVFIANMPTEEVFTAPDYRRADGVIKSSKPLSYNGVVIKDMTFTFKDGQIIDLKAAEGEETLRKLVEDNDGARSLGEVALVPHSSPISQSNITFFNTLFDENASNHLAIGSAYATSVQNGTQMTQDELKAAGLNRSTVHVDFMVGNEHMDIDGITKDGQRIPIFRSGEWAF
ncbi:TPA: aminopeptidase [Streptococcus suis]